MGPGDLETIMAKLVRRPDPAVLVGTETGDDAGVYRLDEKTGVVVTADFITPPVDDPYRYGQIAAANSLSDVYAMGGRPLVALALCAFPKELEPTVAAEILQGGEDKCAEAGAHVVGGHTVRNPELLYGLSVTGVVEPARILRNVGARVGDALVLTKPLGTGLLINGRRKGLGSDEEFDAALASMARLNKDACELALAHEVHAMTDVTGFGLVGHALKMARGSSVTFEISLAALPILDGVLALARAGVTTGSTRPNRESVAPHLRGDGPLAPELDQLLHDPQTSGGLLVALPAERADAYVAACTARGLPSVRRIGSAIAPGPHAIAIRA